MQKMSRLQSPDSSPPALPSPCQKHASTWIDKDKFILDVNKCGGLLWTCVLPVVYSHLAHRLHPSTLTLTRIKRLVKMNQ